MAKMPAVLIVDPDLNSRADLKKALARGHFSLAGEAGLGIDAVTIARSAQPDVVLVAAEEPLMPCLQTVEALANALPETPVVVCSSLSDVEAMRRAVLAGARDYLLKPVSGQDLTRSIYAVLEAEEKRRMRQARQTEGLPAQGTVVTVASLKGGVGKSTLSVNLALALRRATAQSVALVDTEPNYGDVGLLLGLEHVPPSHCLAQVARRAEELDRHRVLDYLQPHPSGLLVLPTATLVDSWQEVEPQRLQRVVQLIAQSQDYVVLDTPSGLNPCTAAAMEVATLCLLVTTPDITSLKDTMLALGLLRSWGLDMEKVKVVLNHTYPSNGIRHDDLRSVLEQDVFWTIPFDPVVHHCAQVGQPAVLSAPDSKMAHSVGALAARLSGIGLGTGPVSSGRRLLRFLPGHGGRRRLGT
ncbi:MAG TPA: P-loop NTPase [Dehalococcoidia bacterium]|nr:P-loop NTPase [Dehalococcoidia bacterium]